MADRLWPGYRALQGFQSYTLMREAGCARSNETQQFCFADASAKKDPSDLYFYYLVRSGCSSLLFSSRAR